MYFWHEIVLCALSGTVAACSKLLCEELSNTSVVKHSDSIVQVINKTSCKKFNFMKLMRRLKVASLKFNIHFHSEQIPGLYNIAPDLMSRIQIQRFKRAISVRENRGNTGCTCTTTPLTRTDDFLIRSLLIRIIIVILRKHIGN